MINTEDKSKIIEISKKYGIARVLLFGSSINQNTESNDIDIAIEEIDASRFFKFYGELILSLSKPVDVIDLNHKTKLNEVILSEGLQLYG